MKRPQDAHHPGMRGSLSEMLLLELCSSSNFFFGQVHWPLPKSQLTLCSSSLKIKDIKKKLGAEEALDKLGQMSDVTRTHIIDL